MSAKTGGDDDDDVEDEYLEDDDDDEEDDFHPGGDDDDDDDDEEYDDEDDDNDDDQDVSYLDGSLTYDVESQKLYYKGHGFHLESTDIVTLNILDKACKPPPGNTISTAMIGPCDAITPETSGRKPTPRKILVTFTVADPNGEGIVYRNLKDDDDDNDEGEKKPSIYYQVYGSEIDNPERGIEFKGGFAPITGGGAKEIRLLCQVRLSNPNTQTQATNATTTTTAAVAVGKGGRNDENDDNMDDIDDDGIDHNELIALHEEAQLSTEALKKRYRGPSMDATNDDRDEDESQRKQTSSSGTSKKKYKNDNGDEEDDDDIEF